MNELESSELQTHHFVISFIRKKKEDAKLALIIRRSRVPVPAGPPTLPTPEIRSSSVINTLPTWTLLHRVGSLIFMQEICRTSCHTKHARPNLHTFNAPSPCKFANQNRNPNLAANLSTITPAKRARLSFANANSGSSSSAPSRSQSAPQNSSTSPCLATDSKTLIPQGFGPKKQRIKRADLRSLRRRHAQLPPPRLPF